ncbi:MAG: hypothetical protein Q8P82_02720, partial [bacterium]|nr:hypothetical protein [bacterium]
GLYHNVLFTVLLIFAAYFLVAQPITRHTFGSYALKKIISRLDWWCGGLLCGAALWVRTAELPWMAIAILVLFIVFRKTVKWPQVIAGGIGIIMMVIPMGLVNQSVYGSPWWSGYTFPSGSVPLVSETVDPTVSQSPSLPVFQSLANIPRLLLPFGIHPRTALTHFANFYVWLPWWMSLVLLGSVLVFAWNLIRRRCTREELACMGLFLGVTGWLVLVYGSWVVRDNPDPNAVTIGNSYLRYWLPSFVLATAVAGMAARMVAQRLRRIHVWIAVGGLVLLVSASGWLVFSSSDDSINAMIRTLDRYAVVKTEVLRETPKQSVVVVDRADKIFFPDRKVMTPLRSSATYDVLRAMHLRAPLYYFGITLTDEDLEYHNSVLLPPTGLLLRPLRNLGNEPLYRFVER